MFCTQCGNQLREEDRFCSRCGKAVAQPPSLTAVAAAPQRRVLRRIMAGKKIAGVCAGFADYFEMDVTLMRIIFVAMAILPPAIGLIAYVVAWIAVPKDRTA